MAFKPVTIRSTTEAQLQLGYDASNYADFTVGSGGDLTIAPTGGDTAITGTLAVSSTLSVTGASTLTGGVIVGAGQTIQPSTDASAVIVRGSTSPNDGGGIRAYGAGHATLSGVLDLFGGGSQRVRLTSAGILALGTTVVTSVSAGELVLANSKSIRAVNGAGTDTRSLVRLTAGNVVAFDASGGGADFAGPLLIPDGISAPSATAGRATLYVDSADGDLKVKFADGITKTLATDT